MRSETRRIASALVETRTESFTSRHPRAESEVRLDAAITARKPRLSIVDATWTESADGPRVEVRSAPARAIHRLLLASSLVLTMLIASSVWVLFAPGEPAPLKFLVPLVTVLGVLGFPLVIVGMGSQREAEDERLRRAIRHALLDEAEFPRPLRDDERT